jgi:hypothetical protein
MLMTAIEATAESRADTGGRNDDMPHPINYNFVDLFGARHNS